MGRRKIINNRPTSKNVTSSGAEARGEAEQFSSYLRINLSLSEKSDGDISWGNI
jgi:hypothetical protein